MRLKTKPMPTKWPDKLKLYDKSLPGDGNPSPREELIKLIDERIAIKCKVLDDCAEKYRQKLLLDELCKELEVARLELLEDESYYEICQRRCREIVKRYSREEGLDKKEGERLLGLYE